MRKSNLPTSPASDSSGEGFVTSTSTPASDGSGEGLVTSTSSFTESLVVTVLLSRTEMK